MICAGVTADSVVIIAAKVASSPVFAPDATAFSRPACLATSFTSVAVAAFAPSISAIAAVMIAFAFVVAAAAVVGANVASTMLSAAAVEPAAIVAASTAASEDAMVVSNVDA